ncbi:hypothetical protein BLNAU_3556 [Blattamonas nauphoetae]|uniref:Transmembrane protein n=1 Tax=Blattamonas nauphoetae TaxID=2049346 RepID=A0ABQ9YCF5_9EUKA|nr:hypothetical protein BLNAU_3556 [Blattamonas nauphoetae]
MPGWLSSPKYLYGFSAVWVVLKLWPKPLRPLLFHPFFTFVINLGLELNSSQIIIDLLLKASTSVETCHFVMFILIAFLCGCSTHYFFIQPKKLAPVADSMRLFTTSMCTAVAFTVLHCPECIVSPFLSLPFLPTAPPLPTSNTFETTILHSIREVISQSDQAMRFISSLHTLNPRPSDEALKVFGPIHKDPSHWSQMSTNALRRNISFASVGISLGLSWISNAIVLSKSRKDQDDLDSLPDVAMYDHDSADIDE